MKIYSMPEGFLTDQEVPVRWRILGILNGFHINGKDLYASNDWLARQLDCSERSISNGVKELETRGEVYCERTKTSRIIKRTLVDDSQEEGSKRLLPPLKPASTPPSKRLLPISLKSNADNKTHVAPLRVLVVKENSEFKTESTESEKVRDGFESGYEELCAWAEARRGARFIQRLKQFKFLKKARANNLGPETLKKRWIELEGDDWRDGFDWASVVSSFDKKPVKKVYAKRN